MLFTFKQIFFVKIIIVCLEFELGKQSGVFRLCGSLNDSDHVYHLQETTALLYPKSFHIGIEVLQLATYMYRTCAIITRGLYNFHSLFEVQKRFFKGLFFLILALFMVSIQEQFLIKSRL